MAALMGKELDFVSTPITIIIIYHKLIICNVHRYSRKILWMELSPTNHDPRVIVGYYLNTVANQGGITMCYRLAKLERYFL